MAQTASDGWTPLFNGKDLAGWKSVGRGLWSVEDGAVVGRSNPEKAGNFWLVSDADYDDFTLRLKFWISPGGNSGVAVRDPSRAGGRKNARSQRLRNPDSGPAEVQDAHRQHLI